MSEIFRSKFDSQLKKQKKETNQTMNVSTDTLAFAFEFGTIHSLIVFFSVNVDVDRIWV